MHILCKRINILSKQLFVDKLRSLTCRKSKETGARARLDRAGWQKWAEGLER